MSDKQHADKAAKNTGIAGTNANGGNVRTGGRGGSKGSEALPKVKGKAGNGGKKS